MAKIPEEVAKRIAEYFLKLYGDSLGLGGLDKRVEKRLNCVRGRTASGQLNDRLGLANKSLLDVGAGWGEFVAAAREHGADAQGIEADRELIGIANESWGENTVTSSQAEELPYASGYSILSPASMCLNMSDGMLVHSGRW